MHIGTWITTKLTGKLVGEDEFGNKYYRTKRPEDGFHIGKPKTERRWVVYNGMAEPSKVPAQWHGWLHFMWDEDPDHAASKKDYAWQKQHKPNLTGTDHAYFPPGHIKSGGDRKSAVGDYESWDPSK